MPPPDFSELVGEEVPPEERERLRRVHELLVAAGPPVELPASLAEPPSRSARILFLPRRRARIGALLAAAFALAAFGAGFWAGERGDGAGREQVAFDAARVVDLSATEHAPGARGVIRIGRRDATGNLPMMVVVEGLEHLARGDYYTVYMTENGKPVVTCGTFNVAGSRRAIARMTVAYELRGFDGFAITEYRTQGHRERRVLTGSLS